MPEIGEGVTRLRVIVAALALGLAKVISSLSFPFKIKKDAHETFWTPLSV
jgi:hypothetical protein